MRTAKLGNLFINRSYALLLSAETISDLGDSVFYITLVLWIAVTIAQGQSWAPLAVAGVALADSIPTFLVGPIAGVYADRWDKRTTMLRMDALRAVLVALLIPTSGFVSLPFVPGGQLPTGWHLGIIYAVVILNTVCSQFYNPSALVMVGDIVPVEQRERAIGTSQAAAALAFVIGPPLAAPLLFSGGVQWAILVNALSYAASFLATFAIRVPQLKPPEVQENDLEQEGATFLRDFRNGLRFFSRNTILVTILGTLAIAVAGGSALSTLNVFFLTSNLHAPERLFGLLGMVSAVGTIAGAFIAGLFATRVGAVRAYWLGLLATGVLLFTYSQLRSFGPALVVLTVIGMVDSVPEVALGPIILRATPREFVGRIASVIQPSLSLARMVSTVLAGYLASTVLRGLHVKLAVFDFNPFSTVFAVSGALVLAAGMYAMVRIRGTTGEDTTSPTAAEPVAAPT